MASKGQKRNKLKEKELSSLILGLVRAVEGKSFLERKASTSLDFPAFRPAVLIGTRSKVVLRCKGYAWTPVLWIFDNSGR